VLAGVGTGFVAFPICHSVHLSIGRFVCPVYCGKMADWTWIFFGWWVGWVQRWCR